MTIPEPQSLCLPLASGTRIVTYLQGKLMLGTARSATYIGNDKIDKEGDRVVEIQYDGCHHKSVVATAALGLDGSEPNRVTVREKDFNWYLINLVTAGGDGDITLEDCTDYISRRPHLRQALRAARDNIDNVLAATNEPLKHMCRT